MRFVPHVAFAVALLACEPNPPPRTARVELPPDPSVAPADDLPPSTDSYASAPEPGGPIGGPTADEFEERLRRALQDRGDQPKEDARLSRLAKWILRRAMHGTSEDRTLVDAVARWVGFPGPTPWIVTFHSNDVDADVTRKIATLPRNVPVSRFGIAAASRGQERLVAVALGTLELTLTPVPKHMTANQVGHLTGTLDGRFTSTRISITLPSGDVRTWTKDGPEFSTDFRLPLRGVNRVELLGDGPSGPVVVANFPLYVDVDEPLPEAASPRTLAGTVMAAGPGGPMTPASVEARMLDLLNADRVAAHRTPVAPDEQLATAARAHSEDMVAHGFFGHVSPTTGTPEDRLRRAHLLYRQVGEDVARAGSAEEAHRGLMQSPAHRESMLGRDFTHVGIGAVVSTHDDASLPDVTVTLELTRERPLSADEASTKIFESIAIARLTHGIASVRVDDALASAARAGANVLAGSLDATDQATKAASEASRRLKGPKRWTCATVVKTVDVDNFDAAVAFDPRVARVGIAAVTDPEEPETFRVVLVVDGVSCN
jgi:uncharacterized protein YkwD